MNNFEDIPVIRRTEPTLIATEPQSVKEFRLLPMLVAIGVLGAGAGLFALTRTSPPEPARARVQVASTAPQALLGHYRYQEALKADLIEVDTYRGDKPIFLHRGAAPQYRAMLRAAHTAGIEIVAISGFRSENYQEQLYTRQLGKARTVDTATLINAPPGYSEHHTGYAVDLGDGNRPDTDTQLSFERTAAFRWLSGNAGRFGFEMSFARKNAQKVSYEPWHWRFVGNRQSVETFYK